jgi:hypothetical protein
LRMRYASALADDNARAAARRVGTANNADAPLATMPTRLRPLSAFGKVRPALAPPKTFLLPSESGSTVASCEAFGGRPDASHFSTRLKLRDMEAARAKEAIG